jgi:hypothetical protein
MAPKDSTFYDFDQYEPRGELFKVEIATNADYTNGMTKAKNQQYQSKAYKFD